jgi:hypothetical protein
VSGDLAVKGKMESLMTSFGEYQTLRGLGCTILGRDIEQSKTSLLISEEEGRNLLLEV